MRPADSWPINKPKTIFTMKKPIFTLLLAGIAFFTQAQTDPAAAVKATIQQLFEGMSKSDSTLVRAVIAPGARLETILKSKDGIVSVKSDSYDGFMRSIAKSPAGSLDERLSSFDIKVDAELATAWTPYQFYYNGKLSHCGVNAFQLVKLNGTWKIWSIIDTRRREGCDTK
jgi:hypothetical protein